MAIGQTLLDDHLLQSPGSKDSLEKDRWHWFRTCIGKQLRLDLENRALYRTFIADISLATALDDVGITTSIPDFQAGCDNPHTLKNIPELVQSNKFVTPKFVLLCGL